MSDAAAFLVLMQVLNDLSKPSERRHRDRRFYGSYGIPNVTAGATHFSTASGGPWYPLPGHEALNKIGPLDGATTVQGPTNHDAGDDLPRPLA